MAASMAWVDRLLVSEPTLSVQLLETLLLALAFGVIMPISTRLCSRVFKKRPWYPHASELMRDTGEKMLGIEVTDEMTDKGMGQMVPILLQHILGGLLCLPAIFGMGVPRATAFALARHGALLELGWELQDTAERLHERFFFENGEKLQPNGLFFFMGMHHAMQWALVIPMNLYYSELAGYHELVFMLEGAAGVAMLINFYGYTLDVSKKGECLQMVITNAFGLVVMAYTRAMHYWVSLFKCLSHFYAEGCWVVLVVGVLCGACMMPYIGLAFIPQQWSKLLKFFRMYMAHDGGRIVAEGKLPSLLAGKASDLAKAHIE